MNIHAAGNVTHIDNIHVVRRLSSLRSLDGWCLVQTVKALAVSVDGLVDPIGYTWSALGNLHRQRYHTNR